MTRDEARRRAVEAALWAYLGHSNKPSEVEQPRMQAALDAAERAMADAGWRMVRDCGECEWAPANDGDEPAYSAQHIDGWNACRAAMLGDDE